MKNTKIKYVALALMMIIVLFSFCGCNMTIVDTNWNFNRAIVNLVDGSVIDGKVQSWTDFDGSDMIQVKIDGVVYLTHSSNVVLIAG